jgi:integrase
VSPHLQAYKTPYKTPDGGLGTVPDPDSSLLFIFQKERRMGRPRKPHFRESDGWWVSMFRGERIKLAKGRGNQAEALKRYHELMAVEAVAVPPESPDATSAAICEAFLGWSAKHNTPATYEFYRIFLQDFCTHWFAVRIVDLKPYHVTRWLDGHATWGATTRRGAIGALKRALNWATSEGLIRDNPLKAVKKPRAQHRERILTADEEAAIDAATSGPFKLFLLALRQSGARPGEVARVTAAHVSLDAGTWTLPEHKTSEKTGKPRVIYLTPQLLALTEELVEAHPAGPLFRNNRGTPWTRNAIRCRMRRLRKRLNLKPGVVAYTYRHTYTTEGLTNGVPIATMAELLGHVDTKMISEHYGHLRQKTDHLRQAAAQATRTTLAASA